MKPMITNYLQDKIYFGHPSGLLVLFMTMLWERFAYYGMRALLVLYMTQYLLFEPDRAADIMGYTAVLSLLTSIFGEMNVQQISSQIYGIFTGLVYFTPFFGGMIADKVLGQYKTVKVGSMLMAAGYFLMMSESLFLVALIFLILGGGAFKPNITAQLGNLYPEGDKRRDSAYTIFYMGINLGALFAPLVCGTLGQIVGWHWGFGAAGVGMLLGLFSYWLGSDLVPKGEVEKVEKDLSPDRRVEKKVPLTKEEWKAIWAIIVLCFLNITFWAIFEQQGNVLQLWADEKTNWSFLGIPIPSTWYQSFNPAFIFAFSPILIWWWARQKLKGKEPSSIAKMGFGSILCGAAYVVMILNAMAVPGDERGSILWLTMTTLIFTIGEIYLSPIGLSLVTKVSPKRVVSTMMGFWFMSSFFGNYLTGYLGTFYSTMSSDEFFAMLTLLGIGTGVIFYLIEKPMVRVVGPKIK